MAGTTLLENLPEGDVIVHCGDFTEDGTEEEESSDSWRQKANAAEGSTFPKYFLRVCQISAEGLAIFVSHS